MSATFVEISRDDFEAFLASKGFVRGVHCSEVVYSFDHKANPNVHVKVYTSLADGRRKARACGKDAIRVVAVFDNGHKSFGICKLPRVFRVGSQDAVFERTLERMREAYRTAGRWIQNQQRSF